MTQNYQTDAVCASTDLSALLVQPVEPGLQERLAVLVVWDKLQLLLISGPGAMQKILGLMSENLPHVEGLPVHELADLARLHIGSATNLRHTMRVLVPDAFPSPSSTQPNSDMVNELDSTQSDAVAVLIDLQLFHLHRASALLSRHKQAVRALQQEGHGCESAAP